MRLLLFLLGVLWL